MTEILKVLGFFEGPSDNELFLVFLHLVPVVVPDWNVLPTFFLLLSLVFKGLSNRLFWDVLISRSTYNALT